MSWVKKGFEEFKKGTFGNGGQNIYASANGVLQRIFNYDLNGDGFTDLPITNSHSMNERTHIEVYDRLGQGEPLKLPSNGSYDAIFTDLTGDGTDDLVVACQHNGVHSDVSAVIYFGSEIGLSEKYKLELRVPNSLGVTAGDFDGSGKKSLVFISNDKLRVFKQSGYGIEASVFSELPINAISLAAGDLDGDGYDDLYVVYKGTGRTAIYWGGEDGINLERKTEFGGDTIFGDERASSTTAGRKFFRWLPWRNSIVDARGKKMTFRPEGDYAVFESFDKNRQPKEEIRVLCEYSHGESGDCRAEATFSRKGAMHAVSGDLRGNGADDIVISVASDFSTVDNSIVLWESDNYSADKATKLPIRAARILSVGKLEENGKNYLFVAQSSEMNRLSIETSVFSFNEDKSFKEECRVPANEPVKVMSGKTYTDGRYQLAVVNFEGENLLGFESVYVFTGGKDGYSPERRLEFPSCAAVDTLFCDFNDDGRPDVLVVNCAENAPHLTPGSVIYWNGKEGFNTETNKNHFYSDCSHGAVIGDFRKCGYLDIVMGGIFCRELRIFEGGPDGYDFEHPKYLILGPEPEKYAEEYLNKDFHERLSMEPEIRDNYATVRWLFAADFNGDGWLDIFVSEICGKRSFILWGGPDGFSTERMQKIATDGVASANAADLNGNGYLDLILAGHQSLKHTIGQELGKFEIYWGGPDGYKENRKTQLPAPCCNALTIQDFNGDGRLDIYGTAYSNGRCRDIESFMYFQSEDGVFHQNNFKNIFNHSGCGCLAGDFNGDGYIDLLVASHKAYGNHVNKSYIFWGGEDGINEQRYTELPCRGPHGTASVDIGNIMDRSNSEYYYSEVYDTKGKKAIKASWIAENGKKTWVKIRFRCAKAVDELKKAEWSESFENGADISALNLKGYIQYSLELGAYCGTGTPRVTEITVDFE